MASDRAGPAAAAPAPQPVDVASAPGGQIGPLSFLLLTVTATGGPLALAVLYVPGVLGEETRGSAGVVAVLGAALFVPPLLVWLRYSRVVRGPGGLTAFVAAGVGTGIARVQAGLWVLSYLLYLVYTSTYVAYDIAPAVSGSTGGAVRPVAQMLTAVIVIGVAMLPLRRSMPVLSVLAVGQLVLLGALVAVEISQRSPVAAAATTAQPREVLVAGGNLSILFVCSSLPLFLGGEARGGGRTVRTGLARGWAVAAAATGLATVPLAFVAPGLLGAELPGAAVARAAGLPLLATTLGVGVVASVVGLMVVEFMALSRLLASLSRLSVGRVARILAVVTVTATAATLIQPERAYNDLLKPSLVALWLSQLIVFVAYPFFVHRQEPRRPRSVVVAAGVAACAGALMLFGLWSTIVNQLGT